MSDYSSNNKRIAKNTLFLYARLLLMMAIALFTSRVILDSLGEDNFGIHNVVGGVVALFAFIQNPLILAIQRFITFELGSGNNEKLKNVFSTSVNIQILIACVIFLLSETIGLWFLNTKMSIPADRMGAANFVLQCSIITTMTSAFTVPYNATIIAHERMNIFAYFSILEAILKLTIAYLIYVSPFDKLKLYASLLLAVSLLMQLIYVLYCKKYFEEARFQFGLNKPLFKEMAGFAGWSFVGNASNILNTQGVNMLINVFFGVKANAARAIALQVDTALLQFVNGFTTAVNPAITKSYASNKYGDLYLLISRGSKFSFYIMLIMIVPLLMETDAILGLWLKEVPADTSVFLKLVLLYSLITSLATTMVTGITATGNIKRYQIIMNLIGCLIFPITWLVYKLGTPAYTTYVISIIIMFFLTFVRLGELKRLIDFPVKSYLRNYFYRMFVVCAIAFLCPIIVKSFMVSSTINSIFIFAFSILWTAVCIYILGLDKYEKKFFLGKLQSILVKNNK